MRRRRREIEGLIQTVGGCFVIPFGKDYRRGVLMTIVFDSKGCWIPPG
jgi:hypothetical protein